MKKMFKTVEEKLREKGILGTTVDLDPNWYENIMKKENERKENDRKEEQERIDKLKCPSCKSTDKEHIIKSDSNGILGPGYHSWLIDEYFVCNNCGIMFKDISKRKK
jgi:protein-arginine kinase activator protein McsA